MPRWAGSQRPAYDGSMHPKWVMSGATAMP